MQRFYVLHNYFFKEKFQPTFKCNTIAEKVIEFVHKKNNLEYALLLLYKNVTNIV